MLIWDGVRKSRTVTWDFESHGEAEGSPVIINGETQPSTYTLNDIGI